MIAGLPKLDKKKWIQASKQPVRRGFLLELDYKEAGREYYVLTGFKEWEFPRMALVSNRDIDIPRVLDRHAFYDRAGVMGKLAYELGNIYQSAGIEWANSSVLSAILQRPLDKLGRHPKIRQARFGKVLEAIDAIMQSLEAADLQPGSRPVYRPELYQREFQLAARMLKHACWRGILAVDAYGEGEGIIAGNGHNPQSRSILLKELREDLQGIVQEYEQVWLCRNRPGGLADSVSRLKILLADYQYKE